MVCCPRSDAEFGPRTARIVRPARGDVLRTFSWSVVYISLPFHIQAMTTWDEADTLRWTGWIIGITLLVTVFFLASVLPQVVAGLGIEASRTLEIGGVLIFASGVAAALGSVAAPRLSQIVPERRLLAALLIASTALAGLGLARSAWLYGIVRFVQVLCVAPVFPIVVARIAHSAGGDAIGIINSARIGAGFLGPVLATSLLAWTSPAALYVALGAIGVACLPLVGSRAAEVAR